MKREGNRWNMARLTSVLGLAALGLPSSTPAATVLSEGHIDIGIAYEGGAWDLHVHKELPLPDEEFEPGEAVFLVGNAAKVPGGIPNNPSSTAFFGVAGMPLWVLPKTQNPALPFLGIGTEELDVADWVGNLTLTLEGVRGPGDFFLWDVGSFGELLPKMSSRDGVTAADKLDVVAGSHGHYFMGFTAAGEYEVDFSASGVHGTDGPLKSDAATYRFSVVPEPGVTTLLLVGGAMVFLRRDGRRRV